MSIDEFLELSDRAIQGDPRALSKFPVAAHYLLASAKDAYGWRPVYGVMAVATKHGSRRSLQYGESLAMRGDGETRRAVR